VLGTLLWFDPTRARELSAVSHARSAMGRRQKQLLWSERTSKLVSAAKNQPVHGLVCPFHRPFSLGPLTIELLPSGYMLGAAQFQVTFPDGHRLLYADAVSMRPSATAEAIEISPCDTLLLDSHYGHSSFRFPATDSAQKSLLEWIAEQRRDERTPIILTANPGKAQDLLHFLGSQGHTPVVHRSIFSFKKAYLALGIELPSCTQYRAGAAAGQVVIWPSALIHSESLKRIPRRALAIVSGRGIEDDAAEQLGVDRVFTWSARADFGELTQYVKQVNPNQVITTGRWAENFAAYINKSLNISANALVTNAQLALI
jgi:putative mRNA 3-end processing factor